VASVKKSASAADQIQGDHVINQALFISSKQGRHLIVIAPSFRHLTVAEDDAQNLIHDS